jgi:hypothetical protein
MCIEESEEDEVEEHHFVEAQIVQKDAREENIVAQEKQLFIEVWLIVQQAIVVQTMVEAQ